ncbi:DUF3558 family protein [Lentzea aerocolonigenes]|uniref:DUF3558 family protein n=1 Tax=Lentzea aerocolonigenes TaxID=68170 RepID=UPI0012DED977|nr:DUF3558 family protein [Lentzea aerocolonigenes]
MTSRIAMITLAVGAAVTLSACSGGPSTGTPRPATETTTTTSTSAGKDTTSLAETDPCSLLTSSEASELGASGTPKREKVGTADVCKWRKPGEGNFDVSVRANLGLAEVKPDGGQIADLTVGSRKAKKVSGDGSGVCIIALDVSSSSRVDVSALGRPNEDSCPVALKLAELVDPKLP